MKTKNSLSAVIAWCLYDWACSSYSSVIITFIFATYFTTRVAANVIVGTYQWANATSIAGIIIALLSPLMGSIADRGGYHKQWLLFFTLIAVISAALLWFSYPAPTAVHSALLCIIIGTSAYEIGQVFYNAFLPTLVTKNYIGRVSGWGWGCGYIGGIAALSLALLFVKGNGGWLDSTTYQQIRICGPFVAVWFLVFSIPLFVLVPNLSTTVQPLLTAIREGCYELFSTLKKLPQEKNILLYLLAHMIYMDGLNTLFAFGGIYAAGTFKFSFEQVLLFGISMNITAGLGAIVLAWVDDYLGSKLLVLLSLFFLILFGIPLLLVQKQYSFWLLALCLSIFIGPVQSASRSLMVHLIKHEDITTEMFGLYALSGRITAFIGPWLLGITTLHFANQRAGMATVLCFFAVGALLLLTVNVKESS